MRARAREIERANAKLEHKLQRAPTDEEMADELDMHRSTSSRSRCCRSPTRRSPRSTSCGPSSDSSGDQVSLLDTLQDPDAPDPAKVVDASELKDRVADAIARLPEREKLVIALYYYENLTLREIGEVLGVTESRVSQLHTKAVLRLRSRLAGARAVEDAPAAAAATAHAAAPMRPVGSRSAAHHGEESCGMHTAADRIRNVALVGHRGQRQDLAARGAAVRGRRDQPARLGRRTARPSPTPTPTSRRGRCRSRRRSARSSGSERKINLLDTPGEPSFVADALGALRVCESAVFVVNAVMGVEVSTTPPVGARRRARHRAACCS